ncbi:hypothetical protein MES5069_620058 [Mesorhizobium escarrei]|uniref:Uncharacterized protein n=1 Tax=Mesorhizobium escarrei TaxID=666018 RepID=A0ABM9EEH0_9HYPH|nr:hypothetical protein MES5069_620058 [Mesorhizobium escarrei]
MFRAGEKMHAGEVIGQPRTPWSQAMRSQDGFRREQAEIGKIWQLVGLMTSIEHDKDWFRSTLGGRSIFVQRFKDESRGFENVCAPGLSGSRRRVSEGVFRRVC